MFKVHLPSDLLPENSPEARGRRFMDRVNQRRQMIEQWNRQCEAQEKPGEGAADSTDTGARIAELEAENARLRGVLSSIQWCSDAPDDGIGYHLCPICDQSEVRGHAPDCTIGAVLEAAEVPRQHLRGRK